MKAVVMTASGGPEVLELREVAQPVLTADTEMLVRLKAAGINPVDTKIRAKGGAFPLTMPAVLGCDGAGVVEAVGAAVSTFKVGDEVYFCQCGFGTRAGTYAQYAVVDSRFAAHKPGSLSFAAAAAAPLVLITAWEALHDRGRLQSGQSLLVHAGAGGVGHVAIQLASLAGARVLTTVGSDAKAELAESLGADEAIRYKFTDFVAAVLAGTDGAGVDLALDTVGGATFEATFPAVRLYGDLVTLLQPGAGVDWTIARQRNLRVSFELMLTPMLLAVEEGLTHHARILGACAGLFDEGRLRVVVDRTYALDDAAAAHRALEEGGATGKLVLEM
jgi:NADPH2:quinone reductase